MRSRHTTTRNHAESSDLQSCTSAAEAGRRSGRGLTLIEAIAMVTIMAIAVPTMMWSMAGAHENRVAPLMASRARFLASERLEQVIADRSAPLRGFTYVVSASYPAEPAVTGFPNFSRSVAINETDASLIGTGVGYKTATVTVTWTTRKGSQRTALATVVTEY